MNTVKGTVLGEVTLSYHDVSFMNGPLILNQRFCSQRRNHFL